MPADASGVRARRVVGLIGMILIFGGLFGLGAQVASATDQPGQTIKPAITVANAGKPEETRTAEPALTISAVLPRPIEKPMLPFVAPQVGPIIKRAFSDDIERRTTAFIPTSLNDLTPIAFPKNEKKWIRVDLSEQIAVAYEGNRPIRAFVISSGLPGTPTVTGEFRIRTKVKAQTMTGGEGAGYYSLPNVKWVQYFYQDYSFHGTYWHNDFGRPKSHGCLNMTNADAKWLFDWAGPTWDGKTVWFNSHAENPGTLVVVHE